MKPPLSVLARSVILLVLASLFAATLVALSHNNDSHPALSVLSWSSQADRDTKTIDKSFQVQPGDQLSVNVEGADIAITGSECNEVVIKATVSGDARKVSEYEVQFKQEGTKVSIDGQQEQGFFRFNRWGDSFEVRYEIRVPNEFNVQARTSGGNISIERVKGDIDGETSGGNLDLVDLEGKVDVETSGGDVSVRRVKGEVKLETSGGNIDASEVEGSMDTQTSGGNIRLKKVDGSLKASTSGGNIRVTARDNKGMELETSGGNIVISLDPSVTATVDAEATGGDVDCEIDFSGRIKNGSMRGKINGGGSLMKLRSTGGNITIGSRD